MSCSPRDDESYSWYILEALKTKNEEELKRLIKQGAPVNVTDSHGFTPLHYAVTSDDMVHMARILVVAGAFVDRCNIRGETPLYIACQNSSELNVELLLQHECDVDLANEDDTTALHVACTKTHVSNIVKLLIQHGADIDCKDHDRYTPIHYAIESGNASAVAILLDAGCDFNLKQFLKGSPFRYPYVFNHIEIFHMLIGQLDPSELNEKYSVLGHTLLMIAVQYRFCDAVSMLICYYDANTSLTDNSRLLPLHLAARCNDLECFQLLLKHTPISVINRYSTSDIDCRFDRSLPCILMKNNMLVALKILFDSGVKDEVLSCPVEVYGNIVSPLGFLLMYMDLIDDDEKFQYLQLYATRRSVLDPIYQVGRPIVRTIEAVLMLHVDNCCYCTCNCIRVLKLFLSAEVDPDVPDSRTMFVPKPYILAFESGFIPGLALLLQYSNIHTPDSLLEGFVRYISQYGYKWTAQEGVIMMFLVKASTFISRNAYEILEILSSAGTINSDKFRILYDVMSTELYKVQSLRKLSRQQIRQNFIQFQNGPKSYRRFIDLLDLPKPLSSYLCYSDL